MKRLLSLLLCAALVLTGFSAFAEDTAADASVVSSANDEYVKILNLLGVTDATDASAYATRIDFAEMLLKAYGSGTLPNQNTVFADVSSDDEKSGYVSAAYDYGFMGGFSDKHFRPYSGIEYNQAVKAVVSLLGYGPYAQVRGGYPAGYLHVANSLRITSGIDLKNGTTVLTNADVCRLIYNAITTEIMTIEGVENDTVIYEKNSEKTLLSDSLEIAIVEGQLTETYFTAIGGKSTLDKDEVRVGKNVYTTSVNLIDSLGKNMEFYIQTSDENYGNILCAVDDEDTFEITLDVDSISSIEKDKITYFNENDKEKYLDLSLNTKLIYNGVAKNTWSAKDIQSATVVRLLDIDDDGECDFIFADKLNNKLVNRVNIQDETLYFKNSPDTPKIQIKEPVKYVVLDADGSEINFADIEVGDVISYTQSADKKIYKLYRSKETVAGTINELNVPDKLVKIDETVYTFDSGIAKSLVLGDNKVFCIDFRGVIVAVGDDVDSALKYGYLINTNKTSGMEEEAQLKIFTVDGEIKIFDVAKRVRIGNEPKNEADAYTSIEANKEKLIKYSLNQNDEVNKVVFAVNASSLSDADRYTTFRLDENLGTANHGFRGGSLSIFAHRYRVDGNTIIFNIPSDLTKENEFRIYKRANLTDDQEFSNIKIYDVDENYITKVMVGSSATTSLVENSSTGVLTGFSYMSDENGEKKKVLKLVDNVKEYTYYVSPESVYVYFDQAITDTTKDPVAVANDGELPSERISFSDLEKMGGLDLGDIIQYTADKDNNIGDIRVLFRCKYPIAKEYTTEGWHETETRKDRIYSKRYTAYGEVLKSVNGAFSMMVEDSMAATDNQGPFLRVHPVADTFTVVRYNMEKGFAEYVTPASIYETDKVYIQTRHTNTTFLVVYK